MSRWISRSSDLISADVGAVLVLADVLAGDLLAESRGRGADLIVGRRLEVAQLLRNRRHVVAGRRDDDGQNGVEHHAADGAHRWALWFFPIAHYGALLIVRRVPMVPRTVVFDDPLNHTST
jgi:hypothetical protein